MNLLDRVRARDSADAMLRARDRLVVEVIQATPAVADVTANRVMWVDGIDDELLPFALADVDGMKLREVQELTAGDGLLGLLGYDRELIEGTAALGLASALTGPYPAFAEAFLAHRGLSYERVTQALDGLTARHGVGRLFRAGDMLLSSI